MTDSILSNIIERRFNYPIDREKLLTIMSEAALKNKWVKPGYLEALLTREKKYPTGLHTLGVEVAIPHADPEWTVTPGMIVSILDQPTEFEPMGGQGDIVKARFVFLLLIPDADTHLQFLQTLAEFIEDEAKLSNLGKTKDITPLLEFFKKNLEAE
jgi:PTS system galactitol-specific IIA component